MDTKPFYSDMQYRELETRFIDMSAEWARGMYLLRRIAGWVDHDPVKDPEHEARMFLKMYDHHPPEWGEQRTLL